MVFEVFAYRPSHVSLDRHIIPLYDVLLHGTSSYYNITCENIAYTAHCRLIFVAKNGYTSFRFNGFDIL